MMRMPRASYPSAFVFRFDRVNLRIIRQPQQEVHGHIQGFGQRHYGVQVGFPIVQLIVGIGASGNADLLSELFYGQILSLTRLP